MADKVAPKVIILSLFEPTGDTPGEQSLFRARLAFTKRFEIPGVMGPLLLNDAGIGALLLGIGATKPAISLMALGCDERFDIRHTYFMIAGIAGTDPHVASLGSVAWAQFAVDGNLAFDIDAREIPPDWPTGIFPLGSNAPYEMPPREAGGVFLKDEVFKLNGVLRNWAFDLTKEVALEDTDGMKKNRALYTDTLLGRESPRVIKGDVLASERFWHGRHYTEWAQRWVSLWTEGEGTFVMSSMEEMGALRAFEVLAAQSKIDFRRIMILRSASNYCMQPPGKTAVENMTSVESEENRYPAYRSSLENLFRVGSVVALNLASNWRRFKDELPSS